MMFGPMRRIAAVAALAGAAGLLTTVTAAGAAGTSQPQRRQLAVTALSDFKVVLTASREPGHPLLATVTAAGFRRSDGGWTLIATKRIGQASEWSWFATQTCSLRVTQFKNSTSPSVVRFDSISVSLLITPSVGCSPPFSKRWIP